MTKREAAIVAAYTGILIGPFSDMHEYVEEVMGRSVMTHEMADPEVWREIKAKSKADFVAIKVGQ